MAVGVGVVLAQAERTRRLAKAQRARERRFAQLPGEPLGEGLRRMALGQLDLAIEQLAGEEKGNGAMPDARAIHETRKALKRLRALLRLLREELGEQRFAREYGILRDAARRLAGARDAEVMVGTLDALLERHPRALGRRRTLIELRKRLVAERAAAARRTLGDETTRAEVLGELRGLRGRASSWRLGERPGIAIVESDLRRVYRQGRRRHRRAARSSLARRKRGRALHEWRKRVKDLRYAAEMLGLRPLARRADTLAEILGEEHDLALLAALLPAPGRAPFKGKRGKQARRALLQRIARRRRRLRKRALREGERLYRCKPKRFARRVRRAHARASRG
ncbi:MAG TPA: CHAD domain-containing protein [Solirubrobacteraceae bacterium]|nr:CHAD domain-containing protein [Solirubrobacteraceae bacterium]